MYLTVLSLLQCWTYTKRSFLGHPSQKLATPCRNLFLTNQFPNSTTFLPVLLFILPNIHAHMIPTLFCYSTHISRLTAHPNFKPFPATQMHFHFLSSDRGNRQNRFCNLIHKNRKKLQFSQNTSEIFLMLQQNGKIPIWRELPMRLTSKANHITIGYA